MAWLVWVGIVLSVAGLAALIWCIQRVWRARASGLNDEALRDSIRRVVPVNMAALFASVLGLMLISLGIVFG